MHPGALRALEFDRIVAAVGAYAQTPMGAAWLAELAPSGEPGAVVRALSATAETVRFLADGQIHLQAPSDLEDILGAVSVEGRALEPLHLLALAGFLGSVESTAAGIRRARGSVPNLRRIADTTASFQREITEVRKKIA